MSHHSRIDITSIDVCVHARSQHRGIYDTHDTTTAPHTDRPFDAVEGATALSATRFHFMWTCVSADSPSSAPLLSPYFPFFHCRGSDFVTGFEEPDSALLPPSGSFWSSSSRFETEKNLQRDLWENPQIPMGGNVCWRNTPTPARKIAGRR